MNPIDAGMIHSLVIIAVCVAGVVWAARVAARNDAAWGIPYWTRTRVVMSASVVLVAFVLFGTIIVLALLEPAPGLAPI